MRSGPPKVNVLNSRCPLNNKMLLHMSAAFPAQCRGTCGKDAGPTGRAGREIWCTGCRCAGTGSTGCRAASVRSGWGCPMPDPAGPTYLRTGKTLPGSEEKKSKKHSCEHPGERRRRARRLPCIPWRAHLEQVLWDRIHGGSHAGGGGYVLKEPWPALEQGKSMRIRREKLFFPIPLCQ